MGAHFSEVGVVADVVTDAVFVHIGEDLGFAGEAFRDFEGFEDRAGIGLASAEVVNLSLAWGCYESCHEAGDIKRVDVVADLFAFVAEDAVFATFEVAFHEVAQEAVEFDPGVVRTCETTSSEAAGWHSKVATVFLHHDIGGDFGSAE